MVTKDELTAEIDNAVRETPKLDVDEREARRDRRIEDILRFAGATEGEFPLFRSMLQLAYESGYLHGHTDAGSKVLDIVRKSYR